MKRQQDVRATYSQNVKMSIKAFNVKLLVVVIVFLLLASVLAFHFFDLQIVQHDVLAAKAASQQYMTERKSSRRGMILDRHGQPLVLSTYVYRIGITPRDVNSRKPDVTDIDIVNQLSSLLELDDEKRDRILEQIRADRVTGWTGLKKQLIGEKTMPYMQIASEVPETKAMALKDWLSAKGVGGVRFDAEERRIYNNQMLASPVLGMTRVIDGKLVGVSGLEAKYNALLSGADGYLYARRNNYSNKGVTPFSTPISYPVESSLNLVSTLDMEVQTILQEELLSIATAAGLKNGVHGLVMEVDTGDILAMAQVGGYDAAQPAAMPLGFTSKEWDVLSAEEKTRYLSSNLWNNINITDVYEPGSTFKAVTLAIALEENVAYEGSVFSDDPITIQGKTISCYTVHGHGDVTLRQSFALSCNPVYVELGNRIGKSTYYDWIRKFGFYDRTGIDLPAEAAGVLHRNPAPLDFANLTFGESSSVTAIQMARFFAMIGNDGYLVTPRVGCAATSDGLDVMQPFPLCEAKKLLSKKTCERVRSMMVDVVSEGTAAGTFGAIGLDIGGKTGTSRDSQDDDRRTFSFIGINPINDPEYVVLVTLRKPETSINVSTVAARAANRVAARIENSHEKGQQYDAHDLSVLSQHVEIPEIDGMTVRDLAMHLVKLNLAPSVPTDEYLLDRPCAVVLPKPGTKVGAGSTVWLYPEGNRGVEWVTVPDFQGLNYHECVWLASEYGVVILPDDIPVGVATGQDIPATIVTSHEPEYDDSGAPIEAAGSDVPDDGKVRKGQVIHVSFGRKSLHEKTNTTDDLGEE
ncbi:MAG TPA: hypothetical protein GX734_03875 [Clostridiaceae bacterium]|nr:hypothetical protein [Clostridiaceae bacterium]